MQGGFDVSLLLPTQKGSSFEDQSNNPSFSFLGPRARQAQVVQRIPMMDRHPETKAVLSEPGRGLGGFEGLWRLGVGVKNDSLDEEQGFRRWT